MKLGNRDIFLKVPIGKNYLLNYPVTYDSMILMPYNWSMSPRCVRTTPTDGGKIWWYQSLEMAKTHPVHRVHRVHAITVGNYNNILYTPDYYAIDAIFHRSALTLRNFDLNIYI